MRKLGIAVGIGAMLSLAGCGAEDVELTLPAELMEEAGADSIEELAADADEEDGIEEVAENEDGSVSITMTGEAHQEMMAEMEQEANEYIEEIVTNDEFASIEDVTANDSFDDITFVVDQEQYENSFDGFAAFGVSIWALMYQGFDGVDEEEMEVTIHLESAEDGEVFDSVTYPDAFDDMEAD
ncbi:hypothetical protein HUG20_00200 [Salicibibacter cibi]|uniref:Antigen I/II N-terminal domain-containing protein n=1 Tax=Salicibibacter cibi TaxID=2743001 RepID=A0A7T6Z7X2_9BACI|nr:hypothetical protein [Salicibibacter cibi]QQK78503.1 hypothetical protein HUG20_00200 [Salicibibacter cibi]